MDNEQQGVLTMLINIMKDTNKITSDLAVNTTKTSAIEQHLRDLNGKVIKQEERLQRVEPTVERLSNARRRWDDGIVGVFKQAGLFTLGIISTYITFKYFK